MPMHSRREHRLNRQIVLSIDLAMGVAAFLLAASARSVLPTLHGAMNDVTRIACAALFVLTLGLAQIGNRHGRSSSVLPAVLRSIIVAEFLLISCLFLLRIGNEVSRPMLLFYGGFLTAGLLTVHGFDNLWRQRQSARSPHRLVIVGDSNRCQSLARKISSSPNWRVLEIITTFASQDTAMAIERLSRAIRELAVDTVILSSVLANADSATNRLHQGTVQLCETTGTRLQIHADWLDEYSNVYVDHIGSEAVLTYSFSPDLSWPLVAKRGIDILISVASLILLSPLMLLTAVAIKLDSRGPVLFSQVRNGCRGRHFKIYKFRSMVHNAEALQPALEANNEMTGPVFKMARDPRMTRLGRWLRKASIDELPQLFNVLRGDMSLVGPRPPLPSEVVRYGDKHLRRLSMKPGITGPWQVSGRNQITSFEVWAHMDADYIRNWSLSRDILILLRTVGAVLKLNGR